MVLQQLTDFAYTDSDSLKVRSGFVSFFRFDFFPLSPKAHLSYANNPDLLELAY